MPAAAGIGRGHLPSKGTRHDDGRHRTRPSESTGAVMGLSATRGHVMRKATTATSVRRAARALQRRFNEPHAPVHALQRMIGNQATTRLLSGSGVQRMCDTCEEEQHREVQRKPSTAESPVVAPDLESYVDASRGAGQPLPPAIRAHYEPRFGSDFSGVRVHTDSRAAQAASAIHAHAFTTGADIYFGSGRFQPRTSTGDRLLTHELTHVVQQRGTDAHGLQRQPKGPLDPVPPDSPRSDFDCMINLDAGKPQDIVDCCSRAPVGRPCSSHLLKVLCKIPGVDCDKKKKKKQKEKAVVCDSGFKPGTTKDTKDSAVRRQSRSPIRLSAARKIASSFTPRLHTAALRERYRTQLARSA